MVRKPFSEKQLKLVIACAAGVMAFVVILGLAVNGKDPVSGIVTAFSSIARVFWKPGEA